MLEVEYLKISSILVFVSLLGLG